MDAVHGRTGESTIIRQLSCALPPHPNLCQSLRHPTVLPLLAPGVGVLGWQSVRNLTAQLRRWRPSEGRSLAQARNSHRLSLVPRALSALVERHFSGKGYGNSELGVFKVTADQAKPPNWQPFIPFLCESTTGWLRS